ncbi:hypothetical protein ILYODFUR_008598 [Ilyodon furcidens]|uniref:Uncharacterized protein n=1 Tax=Ilyodon furcidens TaxID=33524 RepID=A0ABV0SLT5_9TELE
MITQLSALQKSVRQSPLKRAPAGQSPSCARPRERRARTNLRSPAELARHADVDVIPLQAKIQSAVRFPYGRSLNKESKNKVFGDLRAAPAHLPSDLAAAALH